MSGKLYGLQYLKDDGGLWSDCYMFSHSIKKLQQAAILPDGIYWYAHRSEIERNMVEFGTVTYTTNYDLRSAPKEAGPYYKIVELPLII